MTTVNFAEYIWIDGTDPTQQLRSKMRAVSLGDSPQLTQFPEWGFDGSSTQQAEGKDSDCLLQPVAFFPDPIRGSGHYLVLCEVLTSDSQPHISNTRAKLRKVLDEGAAKHDPWVGFEQEYTLFKNKSPLGWPENGYPHPQGSYYCGVGSCNVFGRDLVETHAFACLEAGVMLYGVNAEVMPGQWEFQIGYRGLAEPCDILTISDHIWIARWLLKRIAEEYGVKVSFDNKPVKGDWNGAGMHTNFSINTMRDPKTGYQAIEEAIEKLAKTHQEHIKVYGYNLHERLTGLHETCSIDTFKYGISDRTASVRIPRSVANNKCGYLEDRRPGANADPYVVAEKLCKTICY